MDVDELIDECSPLSIPDYIALRRFVMKYPFPVVSMSEQTFKACFEAFKSDLRDFWFRRHGKEVSW